MARARLQYLSDAEKEFLHEQTMRVLEEVGVAYNTPRAIDLLAAAGAPVDRERLTARIPRALVEQCLTTVPKRVLLAAREPEHDVVVGDGELSFTTDGTATYMLDDLTGERREGTAEDLRTLMRLFDALPEVDYVWPTVSPRDLDPAIAGLGMSAISVLEVSKHVQDEVREPELVAPLIDILEAVAGAPLKERPIFSVINCTIAPLQHDRPMTEAGLELVRHGVPIFVLPMALCGTTGPMSVVGTAIVNMAEFLSAAVLFQLAEPGCAVVSGVGSAVADMRSGLYLCGAPEVALINMICLEMSKFYGAPTEGSAGASDAKAANMQAGAEGMMTGIACALDLADTIIAFGILDGAQVTSLAKIMLDCETVTAIKRLAGEHRIDDSTALLQDILDVGIGGHFLGRKSTRAFAHAGEVWQPRLYQREPFDNYLGTPLVEEAAARAREIIAEHEVKPVSDDVRRHVDRVIGEFAARRGARW